MRIRTIILLVLLAIAIDAGWRYAYLPFSDRQALHHELLQKEREAKSFFASRLKEVSFTPLVPQKLPRGYHLHAPELLAGGGRESLHIQYSKLDGTILDLYERSVHEGENIAMTFRNTSYWQEQRDIVMEGGIPGYFVRGQDEEVELSLEGKPQKLRLQLTMLAFTHKGTRVVISNSAFWEDALLLPEELIAFANSMMESKF